MGRTNAALRTLGLAYASAAFVVTHVIFLGMIVFLLDLAPWPSVNGRNAGDPATAIALDLGLLALFGLQHSGMARRGVKALSARLLPPPLERATYVHVANAALALVILAWQPVPVTIWSVDPPWARAVIFGLFVAGWALSFAGSLLIDHTQLLGMNQAWAWHRGRDYEIRPFQRHWIYERVRHPIQTGLILAFWATPHMTAGHLVFAGGLTLYILIGTRLEERDLIADFGEDYAAYRARTPALIPRLWRR